MTNSFEEGELRSTLLDLAQAVGELLDEEPDKLRAAARTNFPSGQTAVITATGRFGDEEVPSGAIRGRNNVRAVARRRSSPASDPTRGAMAEAAIYAAYYGRENGGAWIPANRALRELTEHILRYPALRNRLHEFIGQRIADLEDVEAHFAGLGETHRALLTLPVIGDRFHQAVDGVGGDWEAVGERVWSNLHSLSQRTEDPYVLRGFVNSPAVYPTAIHRLAIEVEEAVREVRLVHASDQMLEDALPVPNPLTMPAALSQANTAIEVEFAVPIDTGTTEASTYVARAVELLSHVEDSLRLLNGEDLGVSLITNERLRWGSPRLPEETYWDWTEHASVYLPRRRYFGEPREDHFSAIEAANLSELFAGFVQGVNIPGFAVAMRRFRATYNRYSPGDVEFLLDSAIALEALFLNDISDKELSYRLSNRAARFLADDVEDRKVYVRACKDLYAIRSKIAHGANFDLESLHPKSRDVERLANAIRAGSVYLRQALTRFVLEGGPETKEAAQEFWQQVELS